MVGVAWLGKERGIRGRTVLPDIREALGEKIQCLDHHRLIRDRTLRCRSADIPWVFAVVAEAEHQIVGDLVLVAILKGKDLEDGVGKDGHPAR